MGRMILGIVTGYLLIGVLVVITDRIFAMSVPGFAAMASPPRYYFLVSLGTDFVYSILGGYACSRIARAKFQEATLCLIVLGEVIGLLTQIYLWKTVPHWFGIGLLVAYPIAVWIGSRLAPRPTAAVV